MTEQETIDMDAACLFKDYTHFQLKRYWAHRQEESKTKASGGGDAIYDDKVLNRALEYHSYYTSKKLSESKKEK